MYIIDRDCSYVGIDLITQLTVLNHNQYHVYVYSDVHYPIFFFYSDIIIPNLKGL